jgi:hypothetical protein
MELIGPDLKIWKNVVMDYFNAPSLDLTRGKQKRLPVGWHIWSRQDLKMLHLKQGSSTFETMRATLTISMMPAGH